MCGILFQFRGSGCEAQAFNAARDMMAHRGPDAASTVFVNDGCVALGHRRLSIIDLSEAANQPMQRGHLWIVYNGEIYNFRELREILESKGHQFFTHSDTEVLLAGYEEWGASLCDRLLGMFAFVIWDEQRRRLFGARDHIGQKPLYYFLGSDSFVIASEISAIRSLVGSPLSVRWESIPELLYYGYVPEPNTWFAEIRSLLPGHYLEGDFARGISIRINRYWTFEPDPDPPPISEEKALEIVGDEIHRAISSHLLADVEVGAFLSGGVDSSCVVAVASRLVQGQLKTFCIGMGDDEVNEAPRARNTASKLGTQHFEQYVGTLDFRAPASEVLGLFGQPFADYSFVPTRQVARLARKHVKCVLSGDGGDEVWGGYAHYPNFVQWPRCDWTSWKSVLNCIRMRLRGFAEWQKTLNIGHVMVTPAQVAACLSPDFLRQLGDFDVRWYIRKHWNESLDPFRRAQWADIKTYLPSDILVKVDRCAMRESLEVRPPFLSHRLIEKILNLSAEVKNPGGELKALFKKWLQGRVPDEVLTAPKRGFGLPPGQFPARDVATYRLPKCVDMGIVTSQLVPKIGRLRYTSWVFEMIEAAL